MQAVPAARHTAQPMTLHGAVLREGRLATDWLHRAPPIGAPPIKSEGKLTRQEGRHWQLARPSFEAA